jgi:hypothetical protein
MLALIYVFTIWCVAAILFVTVHEFEPNRHLSQGVTRYSVLILRPPHQLRQLSNVSRDAPGFFVI